MLLTNTSVESIYDLINSVIDAKGEVYLRSSDGKEEFNLKSQLSRYIAIDRLAREQGNNWRVECENPDDELYFMDYFMKRYNKEHN